MSFLFRAEKVQEIVAWLKAHPVSALSRASCDLQILDAAIVEKIEEEIEKCKVCSLVSLWAGVNQKTTACYFAGSWIRIRWLKITSYSKEKEYRM